MKPLQVAALGYLLTTLYVRVGGWDAAPDPLGWVLVCLAVVRLPSDLPIRRVVLGVSIVAALVSIPLVLPAVTAGLGEVDPALGWAVSLPAFVAVVVLLHALAAAAREGEDPVAAGWLSSLRTLTAVVALLPALVLGAGVEALRPFAASLAPLTALGLLVLLLLYGSRAWAVPAGR